MSDSTYSKAVGTIYLNSKGEFAHTTRNSGFASQDNCIEYGPLSQATVFNGRGCMVFPELKNCTPLHAREVRTVEIITNPQEIKELKQNGTI